MCSNAFMLYKRNYVARAECGSVYEGVNVSKNGALQSGIVSSPVYNGERRQSTDESCLQNWGLCCVEVLWVDTIPEPMTRCHFVTSRGRHLPLETTNFIHRLPRKHWHWKAVDCSFDSVSFNGFSTFQSDQPGINIFFFISHLCNSWFISFHDY